jgi:hypothetical protein
VGILEAGSGWVGAMLDRMDAVSEALGLRSGLRASDCFRRQCFDSGDPSETPPPHTIDTVGADCYLGAPYSPPPDPPHTWVDYLTRYARARAPDTRAKVLGQNVRRIYRLAPTGR